MRARIQICLIFRVLSRMPGTVVPMIFTIGGTVAFANDRAFVNAFVAGVHESQTNHDGSMPFTSGVTTPRVDRQLQRAGSNSEPEPDLPRHGDENDPVASAGDDVLAYVGRRATLNGAQSQPVGLIGMRWIQVTGPPVREAYSQGPNLIVVPPEPGVYQFLLVVAEGSRISAPDTVLLTAVNHPEDEVRRQSQAVSGPTDDSLAPVEPVSQRDMFVRVAEAAVRKVPHRPETGVALAEAFAEVGQKMNLYASYAEVHQEISRRIVGIVGAETTDISVWNREVFEPLTSGLAVWVRPTGMDLMDSRLWANPLVEPSRSRLSDGFAAIADGFRNARSETVADKNDPMDGIKR